MNASASYLRQTCPLTPHYLNVDRAFVLHLGSRFDSLFLFVIISFCLHFLTCFVFSSFMWFIECLSLIVALPFFFLTICLSCCFSFSVLFLCLFLCLYVLLLSLVRFPTFSFSFSQSFFCLSFVSSRFLSHFFLFGSRFSCFFCSSFSLSVRGLGWHCLRRRLGTPNHKALNVIIAQIQVEG